MNELINIALWVLCAWFIIQIFNGIVSALAIKEVHEKLKDHLDKIIHDVKVEKHHDTEYWFDNDTDEFLGQGQTIEEITDHVKSRFPNHIFVLPPKGVLCAPDWKFKATINVEERLKHYATK